MNSTPEPKRSRTQIVVVSVVGAGVVAALAAAAVAGPSLRPGAGAGDTAAPQATETAVPQSVAPTASAAPTPQPTASAEIDETQVVKREFSVELLKTEAVQGVAEGPGEIAGPSVRFTIALHNDTDGTIDLSNTVVNAYYGADDAPALPLLRPGGKSLPATLAAGKTAKGVFVFTVPRSERDQVKVTVDTAVNNPVVAFTGAVPR